MDATNDKGFTLIEVISTLIILGIISVVVVSRMSNIQTSELHAYTATLKANLRYVQINAMTTNSICSITISSNTYEYKDGKNMAKILPGQNQTSVTAPSSVTVAPAFIAFDAWGRPGKVSTDSDGDGLLDVSAGSEIIISNSEENKKITIIQETGYIKVQ